MEHYHQGPQVDPKTEFGERGGQSCQTTYPRFASLFCPSIAWLPLPDTPRRGTVGGTFELAARASFECGSASEAGEEREGEGVAAVVAGMGCAGGATFTGDTARSLSNGTTTSFPLPSTQMAYSVPPDPILLVALSITLSPRVRVHPHRMPVSVLDVIRNYKPHNVVSMHKV